MPSFKLSLILLASLLSFSTLAQPSESPRTLNTSLKELQVLLSKVGRPTLLEIGSQGPIVQISEARSIRTFRVTDVRNRVYLAQHLCRQDLPLSFPDGTKGVIVCWLRPNTKANK